MMQRHRAQMRILWGVKRFWSLEIAFGVGHYVCRMGRPPIPACIPFPIPPSVPVSCQLDLLHYPLPDLLLRPVSAAPDIHPRLYHSLTFCQSPPQLPVTPTYHSRPSPFGILTSKSPISSDSRSPSLGILSDPQRLLRGP